MQYMRDYIEWTAEYINKIAETLYSVLNLNPGFEINDVIQKLGGTLILRDTETHQVQLHVNYSENKQDFLIVVPPQFLEQRQDLRFEIAERLGHLLLHMLTPDDEKGYVFNKNKSSCKDWCAIEWENAEYAASLLMPKTPFIWAFEDLVESGKYENADDIMYELSEKFDVSYHNVYVKCKKLGLIQRR